MPGSKVDGLRELRAVAMLSVADLARRAKVSDRIVHTVESGGTCEPSEADRILAAVSGATLVAPESESRGVVESGDTTDAGNATDRDRRRRPDRG